MYVPGDFKVDPKVLERVRANRQKTEFESQDRTRRITAMVSLDPTIPRPIFNPSLSKTPKAGKKKQKPVMAEEELPAHNEAEFLRSQISGMSIGDAAHGDDDVIYEEDTKESDDETSVETDENERKKNSKEHGRISLGGDTYGKKKKKKEAEEGVLEIGESGMYVVPESEERKS